MNAAPMFLLVGVAMALEPKLLAVFVAVWIARLWARPF